MQERSVQREFMTTIIILLSLYLVLVFLGLNFESRGMDVNYILVPLMALTLPSVFFAVAYFAIRKHYTMKHLSKVHILSLFALAGYALFVLISKLTGRQRIKGENEFGLSDTEYGIVFAGFGLIVLGVGLYLIIRDWNYYYLRFTNL